MKKILLLFFLMTISLGYAQPGASPTDPPTRNAWDVLSVYSDSYSNQTGVQFLTFGAATINADYTPAGGNACKYYTGHSYSGIQVNTAGSLDVSSMTHLHFDVWSPNFSSMNIKLESTTGTNRELGVTGTVVPSSSTRSQWISVDLALSTYNLGNILTSLKYIVPVTYGQNATMYVDNIYFYRPATTSQPPTFGTFTVPSKLVGDSNFTITAPTTNSSGAITYTSSNTAVATIVSGNQIHIVGAGTSIITASQAAAGSYAAGSTTASLVVTYPPMTTDAPAAPARNAWDVISLYSSTYTDLAGTNWFPGWGQTTTHSTYTPSSNETHLYQNLNYEGVQLAANTDISAMTTMHVDIYSPDATALDFRIISGGEFNKTLTIVPGQWNSFDIPLSQYTGANLTVLNQLKFQTNPFGSLRNIVYLDNVYFYRAATALPSPTLTAFSIPSKVLGDSSFSITDPTSNSSGAFSYSSSNTSVATVSGSTITVVGLGSSTITATQAGTGSYSSGTITAVFNVTPAAAPTPTVDSTHVISLFSNAYTNVSGTNWFPNWGQTTVVSDLTIQGNTTKYYSNVNYQGVQFNTPINASSMVSLHIDLWTSNCTSLDLYLINQPAPEQKVTLTPTLNGWNSFDILLSQFTSINLSTIGQMKLVGTTGSSFYLDNIYFSDVSLTVAPIISGFTVPAKELGVADFSLTAPTSSSNGAFTYTSSNTNVATISGSTVTVVGIGTTTITANQAASGSYTSGSITANLVVTAPLPTAPDTAAPTPPSRATSDVKSLFSDAYTNVSGTNWFPNWGQSTQMTDLTISGDNIKKYYTMNYEGVNFAAAVNASSMTNLHIDIWTSNCTSFDVYPIVPGQAEQKVTLTPTLAGWNSFDIDLTQYTIPLTNIMQMKFVATPSGTSTVFLDNIYFWKPNTTPSITGFSVPSKLVGSAPFTLTPPTSNSPGAFSYSSSNTSVATISGSTVTVVGAGSTTITATQAASAPFVSGFTSATFSVNYPGPTSPANAPTYDPTNVISLFSDTYTNEALIDWFPNWGQITQKTDLMIQGNAVKKYSTMNYQGVQFASPLDVTSMTHLHLDIWTPNCTTFDVYLINQTIAEQKVTIQPTVSGWNSIDIPVSQYSSLNLANIGQLKFVATPSGTSEVYLDNMYFAIETTKVRTSQCGSTLAALDSQILANVISGAQMYRFEITNGGNVTTYDTTKYNFDLSKIAGSTYGTTYSIRVAVKINDTWGAYGASCNVTTPTIVAAASLPTTQIIAADCGTTLATLGSPIHAKWTYGAEAYRFEVTNGGTVTTYDSPIYYFNLTKIPSSTYSTTYSIRVAYSVNGTWSEYGSSCSVTTPTLVTVGVPTTQLVATECGTTLASMSTPIHAKWMYNTQAYRFELTAGGTTTVYETTSYYFNLNQVAGTAYGTTYSIRVAIKVEGTWGAYGSSCSVTSPTLGASTIPNTQVHPTFCGATLSALDTKIPASPVAAAEGYRFEITTGGVTTEYDSTTYNFRLAQAGVVVANGTTYSIRVKAKINGVYGNYGVSCDVITPSSVARQIETVASFAVSAYPNPFNTAFKLQVTASTDETVFVSVYDMMGKQIENKAVNASEIENVTIGQDYATGIYNVLVSQGTNNKTVRLVKN